MAFEMIFWNSCKNWKGIPLIVGSSPTSKKNQKTKFWVEQKLNFLSKNVFAAFFHKMVCWRKTNIQCNLICWSFNAEGKKFFFRLNFEKFPLPSLSLSLSSLHLNALFQVWLWERESVRVCVCMCAFVVKAVWKSPTFYPLWYMKAKQAEQYVTKNWQDS